jgi:anaerobic ribonucleoside-triphosphate reductase activating protein
MSIVDGDGCRVSLFVSGCRNHCKGCFNPETWDFDYGKPFTEIEENEIIEACKKSYIAGVTILGGEPMEKENQMVLVDFIRRFKQACPDKNIWLFTGYVFEKDLLEGQRQNIGGVTESILGQIDVLVDGPFVLEERDLNLRFRGSRNQRLLTIEDRKRLYNEHKGYGGSSEEKRVAE